MESELDKDPFDLVPLSQLDDIFLRPEDRLWWKLVLSGHLTMLGGFSNVGKTTLVRNIVWAISQGESFLGWSGPAGGAGVLVLDYETPAIDRKGRWWAIYGDAAAGVHRVLVSRRTPYVDQVGVDAVVALLRRHDAKVLVVDTLARAFPIESENDNAEMGQFIALLKSIADEGFAVVVVAHYGKQGGWGLGALRGASSTACGADIVAGLRRAPVAGGRSREGSSSDDSAESDEDDGPYQFAIFKNRTLGEDEMLIYRTGDGGFRAGAGSTTPEFMSRAQQIVEGIVVGAGEPGVASSEVLAAAKAKGVARRTTFDSLAALLQEGRIRQPKRGRYLPGQARSRAA